MTSPSIPQSDAKRSPRRFKLAGNAAQQTSSQKQLLLALRRYEREAQRSLDKARRAIGALTSTDLQVSCANRRRAPNALIDAFYLPDMLDERVGEVRRCIGKLVGGSDDYQTEQRLWNYPDKDEAVESDPSASATVQCAVATTKPLSADSVLAEALQIVTRSHDDALEIDWTESPQSDREAALRSAIIRQVEIKWAENEAVLRGGLGDDSASYVAYYTSCELRALVPPDAPQIGEDLYDAIERWEAERAEESKRNKAIKQKSLLDAARRQVDGGAA